MMDDSGSRGSAQSRRVPSARPGPAGGQYLAGALVPRRFQGLAGVVLVPRPVLEKTRIVWAIASAGSSTYPCACVWRSSEDVGLRELAQRRVDGISPPPPTPIWHLKRHFYKPSASIGGEAFLAVMNGTRRALGPASGASTWPNKKAWQRPTLPPQVAPSAWQGLTSVFGMGRGGTPAPCHQAIFTRGIGPFRCPARHAIAPLSGRKVSLGQLAGCALLPGKSAGERSE